MKEKYVVHITGHTLVLQPVTKKNQFSTEQLPTNFDIKSAGYIAYLQVQDPRNMSRLCSLFEYT